MKRYFPAFTLVLAFILALPLGAQNVADNSKPAVPKPDAAAGAKTEANTVVEPLNAARALLNKRQFSEAAAAFKAILEKEPASADAHAGYVMSLLHAHQLDEARNAATRAVTAAPNSAMVHAAAGDVAFRDGRFADSEKEYRAALQFDPNCARAHFGMGRMYRMVSMRKRAKESFTKAHQLDGDDAQITETWLETLPYAGQLEQRKKIAGDHPSEREKAEIEYLAAAAAKKPWSLASEIKPMELKMLPYGSAQTYSFTGHSEGIANIHKGFGLNVKFNDKVSADLLLDTGASGLLIGRKLAEKIGIQKIADAYYGGIGDKGPVAGYIGWVDKIRIGGVEFQNCLVEVSSRSDVADESGLLGADVFEKFLITLDFREWKMQLAPLPKNPAASSPDDEWQDRYVAPEMQGYTKIWEFDDHLFIPVVVSDKAIGNFVIDTGAGFNSVSPKLASQVTKLAYEGMGIKGVSGSVKEVLNGDKAILQFAKMRVRSDDIPVFDLTGQSNSFGTEVAGFIGIKTLVQTKMTIDYRDGLVNMEVYEFKKARE